MSTGTLLTVWAHPDDESFLAAGLMAAACDRGDRVVVVTATDGEAGTSDPTRWPPRRLAAVRRRELREALAALGVRESVRLGLPDGACVEHDATDRLVSIIEEVRPDTIVTFGPDGFTGHPDHRAVHEWTTAAWRRSGSACRLLYVGVAAEFHHRWGALNDDIGMWSYTTDPPCTEPANVAYSFELSGELLDRKVSALLAHRSQTAGLVAQFGRATFGAWWSHETFADAAAVLAGELAGASS